MIQIGTQTKLKVTTKINYKISESNLFKLKLSIHCNAF